MTWSFSVPFGPRTEPLDQLTIFQACRDVPDEADRRLARAVLTDLSNAGVDTFGAAEDLLDRADETELRRRLDTAREKIGLEPTTAIEQRRAVARAGRDDPPHLPLSGPVRDSNGAALQRCAAPNCSTWNSNAEGALVPTNVRRFWCEQHTDQAGEGDLDPWTPPPIRVGPNGLPMVSEETEAHERAHNEKIAKREAERSRKAKEELRQERERIAALEEHHRKPLPAGWGPPRP
jgi:hypothetical protein